MQILNYNGEYKTKGIIKKKLIKRSKMYYKNIKGIDKIDNHYKFLKNYVHVSVGILWFGNLPY